MTMNPELFPFRNLEWRRWFHRYTTPRDWKRGARDVPFGLGAKTLYVDGTNGNDHNDGLSWKTAFKTIQHAIDEADSWTNIYIKDGTYSEALYISSSKSSLGLIGESWKGVIITSSEDVVLDVVSGSNLFENLYLKGVGTWHYGAEITGGRNVCKNCLFECTDPDTYALVLSGDDNFVCRSETSESVSTGVWMTGARNVILHCRFFGSNTPFRVDEGAEDCLIHDCSFLNASAYGLYVGGGHDNLFFHNNFIDNSNSIYDNGNNKFLENFYDDHSNVDNGFGIATEPYSFTGGSDPRPVVCRNGWLALSWADADLVALASVCSEARLSELDSENIPADINTIISNQNKYWHWDAISGDYHVSNGTWSWVSDVDQALGGYLRNSSNAKNDEIRIPFYVPSTDARTLNLRIRTGSQGGIVTVYVDNSSQGTVDFYSSSTGYNVIKTLSITPARAGMNVFKLEVSGKNASSSGYFCYLSEMWLT